MQRTSSNPTDESTSKTTDGDDVALHLESLGEGFSAIKRLDPFIYSPSPLLTEDWNWESDCGTKELTFNRNTIFACRWPSADSEGSGWIRAVLSENESQQVV